MCKGTGEIVRAIQVGDSLPDWDGVSAGLQPHYAARHIRCDSCEGGSIVTPCNECGGLGWTYRNHDIIENEQLSAALKVVQRQAAKRKKSRREIAERKTKEAANYVHIQACDQRGIQKLENAGFKPDIYGKLKVPRDRLSEIEYLLRGMPYGVSMT